MHTYIFKSHTITALSKRFCNVLLFPLGMLLLGSCSQSHQLGMENDPEELLAQRLADPEATLEPNESICLLNHCIAQGEQSVSNVRDRTVALFLGNTGAGKSTTINALLGHELKQVSSRSLGLDGQRRPVIVVDSSSRSTNTSIMEIGHGEESRTFLPDLVQTPGNAEMFYCDCPGFSDNRGAEINIANAINIRSVLQQAKGVKAVFLVPYQDLYAQRGANVRSLNAICKQMFGSEANLRNHLDSVLLGVTGAPLTDAFGDSMQLNEIREDIQKIRRGSSGSAVHALAERIFLFDPLNRAGADSDFWSVDRLRGEISQLACIPRDEATSIFAVPLTGGDSSHLYGLADCLQRSIINALKRKDHTALGQHWQSLGRLQVVEHKHVKGLIEDKIVPSIYAFVLERVGRIKDSAHQRSFKGARLQLNELISVSEQLPDLEAMFEIDVLRSHVEACENTTDPKVLEERIKKMGNHAQELEAKLRDATTKKTMFERILGVVVSTGAGLMIGGPVGALIGAKVALENE